MTSNHYIYTTIHTTGKSHHGGYCSDSYDFYDIDEHTTRTISVPSKDFIRNHCDSDGEITWSGMEELSKYDRLCSGSGCCGCSIYRKVTKATLKKRRNIKAEFLGDESSDEDTAPPVKAPIPFVNAFRGRVNSTYTANPSWYNTPKKPHSKFDDPIYRARVSQIPCNSGSSCHRKDHPTKPCYYNHSF